MRRTIRARYDGTALLPEEPLDLERDAEYSITIEDERVASDVRESAWDALDRLAGTVDAPSDWSSEHDHYLYGAPKRSDRKHANS